MNFGGEIHIFKGEEITTVPFNKVVDSLRGKCTWVVEGSFAYVESFLQWYVSSPDGSTYIMCRETEVPKEYRTALLLLQ